MNADREAFKFAELFPLQAQIDEMRPLQRYTAQDGTALPYRHYPAESDRHLILIHGSSGHSAYLHAFAKYLSTNNHAHVYLPDLRGHGLKPARRGDIDYVGQLEDDLADLINHITKETSRLPRIFVGGHSSGGGLALRFAASKHGHLAHGNLLLAPYLGHSAPMSRRNAGGWARANIPRILLLSLLDGVGIKHFHGTEVLRFNLPEKYRNGYETLSYSFRMMKGLHPDDYAAALRRCKAALLLLVGSKDEAFHTETFKQGILAHKPDADIRFIADGLHLGIIVSANAMTEVAQWLEHTAAAAN